MEILSPFSFYGGKAKMSSLICDMLDYSNTDIYVEPFGGACRVLLNKPRHEVEIYNDFGIGLFEFFHAMSDTKLSREVISALYDLTPSKELFLEMKKYKSKHENDIVDYMESEFRELSYRLAQKYNSTEFQEMHKMIIKQEYREVLEIAKDIIEKNIITDIEDAKAFQRQIVPYEDYWDIVEDKYNEVYEDAEEAFAKEWEKKKTEITVAVDKDKYTHEKSHEKALHAIQWYTSDILISNGAETDMTIVDMAVATFVTYYLSRDGVGKAYSQTKGNSIDAYYRQIDKLADVAERFKGVEVTQLDALWLVAEYCQLKNAMLYLDPSYLNAEDGEQEKKNRKNKKDLGKGIYNRSFDYDKHKDLALMIQDAQAHIIVSNYDVAPYNELLTEEYGWKRIEIETFTSVGSKKDNKRTEVLWYNF